MAWERARAQTAALGVARSELYPALAAAALSQTGRSEILFGTRFNGQVVQAFQAQLDLIRSLDAMARSIDSWAAASSSVNTFSGQSRTVVPRR